jgi:hypothetical protein
VSLVHHITANTNTEHPNAASFLQINVANDYYFVISSRVTCTEAQNINGIVQDLSPANLVTAIEDNLFAFMPAFRTWPRAEVHDEAEIKWWMTDIPFPLFNSILRAQLIPERIDATIQSIIVQAKLRNVPLLWWIGPATQHVNDTGVS